MKRKLAVAALSIFSLAGPQLASAGQAPYYPEYNQNTYYRHDGWRDRGDCRNGYDRNDYYGDRYGDRDYDDRYYYEHRHAGRSAAIIGGSAAAGAVLGGAAGHGRGAAVGAIIGGVAGVVADQAVRHHHDHDRW